MQEASTTIPSQEALLSGDHEAFNQFIHRESPRLFYMILKIVRDEDEARSVLQETLYQAYIGLDTFRQEAKLSTWIYSIGRNQAYQWLRKECRRTTMEGQEVDRVRSSSSRTGCNPSQDEWNPYARLERAERSRLIREAIDDLSPTHQQVVVLRDLQELTTAETACMLDISEGAVRVRLCRARKSLKVLLNDVLVSD